MIRTRGAFLIALLCAGQAFAGGNDSCPGLDVAALPFADTGTTIGGNNTNNAVPPSCNGSYTQVAGPDKIYQIQIAVAGTLTVTVDPTGANWDPSIYLLSNCNDGNTCAAGWGDDNGGSNTTEVIGPITLPPGTYSVYVDSFYGTGALSSGTYDISMTGTAVIGSGAAADTSITKTDGVASATAGGSTTYTIVASNAGPSAVTGAAVTDTFPAALTCTWTCVGAGGGTCTAAGSGNLSDTVNLPVGATTTYTATCAISAAATGSLANAATVSAGASVIEINPANNSATDTDTLVAPTADLAITKTDGVTSATPGGSVTYTITASNAGPVAVTGATVADTFPAILTCNWTCVGAGGGTCTAAGAGNINDTSVNLPVGSSVTYTAGCTINAAATGTLSNTATVSSAITDPDPANNSATDTDTLTPQADLAITKDDGVSAVSAGGSLTYQLVVGNAGPSNAVGATVADTLPAALTCTWTCTGTGGASCGASGSGNINDTVTIPAGANVTYLVGCTVAAAATGSLSNTATVAAPGGTTDPNPANNSATDTDTISANVAPAFAYTPSAGGTVNFSGGSGIGSTATATITPSIATPGNGSGALATTTTTCSAPSTPFAGFTQTASAVGAAKGVDGQFTGSCTLGAMAVTQTLTCTENQGGAPVTRTFELACPAGTAAPLTSTPLSGGTVTLPTQPLGGAATTSTITFQNANPIGVEVTCTAPAATQFIAAPGSFTVPANGSASLTVTYTSAVPGAYSGTLQCTAGAQTFTFELSGNTVSAGVATEVTTLDPRALQLLILAMLGLGLLVMGTQMRRG